MAGSGNAILFYQMLVRNGVPPTSAMGALTSIMGESGAGLNPGSFNPNDAGAGQHSVGMGQWNQQRLTNLRNFAASKGTDIYNPYTQIGFIEHELQGEKSHVLRQLRGTNDSGAAANIWTADYESPKINNTAARVAEFRPVVNALNLSDGNAVAEYGSRDSRDGGGGGRAPMPPEMALAGLADPPGSASGLASTLSDSVNLAAPASSSMLRVDDQYERPDPDEPTIQAAAAIPGSAGGFAAEELSHPYDQSKMAGGPVATAGLADLFKVKTVGQARQVKPMRRIA